MFHSPNSQICSIRRNLRDYPYTCLSKINKKKVSICIKLPINFIVFLPLFDFLMLLWYNFICDILQKGVKPVMDGKAYYHLPGLFEFFELYRIFLPVFREHREYFYDWCEIGSIYGAPADCLWGGGRAGFGEQDPREVLALMKEYGISARLTFSNSLLREEHLTDRKCNTICALFSVIPGNGVIIYSDLLLNYLRERYPGFYFVSSTTKVLTDSGEFLEELGRPEFRYVVPDFRLNKQFGILDGLSYAQRDKVEFLCNECCWSGCTDRKACYENVREDCPDHVCKAPGGGSGYLFSLAMKKPEFIGIDDIKNTYLPMGFSNFKIEGRGLGSAIVLEFLLYYMTKPEYQLNVRELIYLDSMLDLF